MTNISSSGTATKTTVNINVTADINQTHTSSTMLKNGYCEVDKHIKIYYEIHGSGPNKLLFIMGML